jgi:hypothetical protein
MVEILDQATRNNALFRLTGALAYCDGCFVQLLEGPAASLDGLMPILETDRRHYDIDILDRVTVRERAFPEWAMLFAAFTPESAPDLAVALMQRRRHMPFYRDLLQRMAREQAKRLSER